MAVFGLNTGSGPCRSDRRSAGGRLRQHLQGEGFGRPDGSPRAGQRRSAGLRPGDVLVVTRLDRLARSTRDLLNILVAVGKAGAGFKSLKDAWADTTTPHGRLMLTVLGGLAEFERELIRARTDDGRKRAKARGVRFGRPVKLTAHQRQEAIQRLADGAVQADLARSYGVSQATISRLVAPSKARPAREAPLLGVLAQVRPCSLTGVLTNASSDGDRAETRAGYRGRSHGQIPRRLMAD
jgi:hypothetical protein